MSFQKSHKSGVAVSLLQQMMITHPGLDYLDPTKCIGLTIKQVIANGR